MRNSFNVIILVFIFNSFFGFSQNNELENYLIMNSRDTVFCKSIDVLQKFKEKDHLFIHAHLLDRNEVEYIDTLIHSFIQGGIPHFVINSLPNNRTKVVKLLTTGKIQQFEILFNADITEFYVKSEFFNGVINRGNFKVTLMPVLDSCSLFNILFVRERRFFLVHRYIKYFNKNC